MEDFELYRPCLYITFARHGAVESIGKERRLHGQTNENLSEIGIQQSIQLSSFMKTKVFEYIYTSDQLQCIQTATQIHQNQPHSKLITDKRLREIDLGELAGKPYSQFLESDVPLHTQLAQHSEPHTAFKSRILDVYSEILKRHLSDTAVSPALKQSVNIMIVSHGGWIRSFIDYFSQFYNTMHRVNSGGFPKTCGVYEIRIDKIYKQDWTLEGSILKMNDVSHLSGVQKAIRKKDLIVESREEKEIKGRAAANARQKIIKAPESPPLVRIKSLGW